MPSRSPGFKDKTDFLKRWLSDPQTYPDEFKAWLINFVGQNPNLTLGYSSLPKGYRGDFSELHLKNSGSNTEQDIFWERNADGGVIAKLAGQTFGSSPNRQTVFQVSANQPDSGGSALSQVDIMATKAGTPVVKTLLDSNGGSDWLLAFGGGTLSSSIASSPPGTPVDGDIWIYDGGGYYWAFVYDSGEASNKWKFVGGPPLMSYSATDRGTSGTTTFADPVVTVPRAGDYIVQFGLTANATPNVGTQVRGDFFLYKNDTTEVGDRSIVGFVADVTGFAVWYPIYGGPYTLPFGANDTLKLRCTPTNWDFITSWRSIQIIPTRVI